VLIEDGGNSERGSGLRANKNQRLEQVKSFATEPKSTHFDKKATTTGSVDSARKIPSVPTNIGTKTSSNLP